MLKDVNKFIQKIESMAENINLILLEDFFESSSQGTQKTFAIASKVGKGKPEPEESIAKRVILRRERIAEI